MKQLTLAILAAALTSNCFAVDFIVDDFDGGSDTRLTSRVITPDNSASAIVGSFPGSRFDVFGVTSRAVNNDFADDSVSIFPGDAFGVVSETKLDNFFGVEDLNNNDNLGGTGSATWTFDISGLTNLSLSGFFAAMGDFESTDNSHTFAVQIDGGASQTVFFVNGNDNGTFDYTMEDGTTVVTLTDPLELTDDSGLRVVDNTFTIEGNALITGTGTTLVLTYTAGINDGGSEVFAFDNLVLSADVGGGGQPGDFDGDGDVDGRDFLDWQRGGSTTGPLDAGDLLDWQTNYGVGPLAALSAVPEPTSIALLALALIPVACKRKR